MHMGQLIPRTVGFGASRPRSTGVRRGTTCPAGQVVLRTYFDRDSKGNPIRRVSCGYPAVAAPAAPPPPAPAPVITVQPTFQQAFTPQVSPVFQQVQDSPGAALQAQPIQEVAQPQIAQPTAPSTGISAEDLRLILQQEREGRELEQRAAEQRQLELQEERQRAEAIERDRFAREQAAIQAQSAADLEAQRILAEESRGAVPTFPAAMAPAPVPTQAVTVEKEAPPTGMIILAIIAAGGIAYAASQPKKRGKKK